MIKFDKLRNDPKFHLGLGDVRLTLAMQEEIVEFEQNIQKELQHVKEQHSTMCDMYREIKNKLRKARQWNELNMEKYGMNPFLEPTPPEEK